MLVTDIEANNLLEKVTFAIEKSKLTVRPREYFIGRR
ncbi:DNA-directed DNA polymerase [Klebsiella phage vB_KpnP_MUC100]|uniref:DNA-directed DNA polymerase n=1 Tax=Klebsiella phage vB_KpnP_MUC100 TaxID=3065244 RepID=A0AAX4G463_9CAUD|nr:DNA-directed DNA polymerase [Klebsiella phage vB_KpnP_MUC100]